MNRSVVVNHPASLFRRLDVCVDAHMDELDLVASLGDEVIQRSISNRTEDIMLALSWLRSRAKMAGFNQLRVVVEPTGVYHKLLLAIASRMNMETALVNAEAVKKLRVVLFGDPGKTDERDPHVVAELASRDRVMRHRVLPEAHQLMRQWGKIYDQAEEGIVDAKCRIHRCLRVLFPDLDFGRDFLYGPSGRAIMGCYGFNPYRIVRAGANRVAKKLKSRVPRMRHRSIQRLLEYASASVKSTPDGRLNALHEHELQQAWDDLERYEQRREEAGQALEALYDEARQLDPHLPLAQRGVITKLALARLIGELGPLTDFDTWRNVVKFVGLNLCQRRSGTYKGKDRITKKGRSLARKIVNQIVLPLVKKAGLFGQYYHHKRQVEKMSGAKAMTAVARKFVKMLWGWYKNGGVFKLDRVFVCQSQMAKAA
jgi:transposase